DMKMDPYIENMTICEYLEYEAAKGRRLWDDDSIWEQDDDLEEDQEECDDDGDTFDMWDSMVEDVERIRKFFNVPDEIVQPLILERIHTTPPNDGYCNLCPFCVPLTI
ncbi:hypothetical protein Tco_0934157, partial [Tanacetum coccineum]